MTNVDMLHKTIQGRNRGRSVGKTHAHLEILIGHLEAHRYRPETHDIKDFYYVSLQKGWREHAFRIFIHLLEEKNIPFEKMDRWVIRTMNRRVLFETVQNMAGSPNRLAPFMKSYVEVDIDHWQFNEDGNERPVRLIGNGFARKLWDEQTKKTSPPPERQWWAEEANNIIDWPEIE